MLDIVDAGASYVGGCCGTTPAHIQSISDAGESSYAKERTHITPKTIVTSRTKLLELGHPHKPAIIGERINPLVVKYSLRELRDGSSNSCKARCLRSSRGGRRYPRYETWA